MKKEGKKDTHHGGARSIRTLIAFCAVVALLILGSLGFKFITTVQDSKFDGEHRFTLLVRHDTHAASVISFDPATHSVSEVFLRSKGNLPNVGKYLGIPIDGMIADPKTLSEESRLSTALISYITGMKKKEHGLTTLDLLRLWLLASGMQEKDIEARTVTTGMAEDEIDRKISEMFVDNALANEKVSVEIINATGITGRGSRLERMLSSMGIPVVQVTTASSSENNSSITYADGDTYTLKKLRQLLGFRPKQMTEQELSDIIIVVGRDSESHPLF
jgi:hypothetical protein